MSYACGAGEEVLETWYWWFVLYACGAGECALDLWPLVKPERWGGGAGGGGESRSSGDGCGGSGEGDLEVAGLGLLLCCHRRVDGGCTGSYVGVCTCDNLVGFWGVVAVTGGVGVAVAVAVAALAAAPGPTAVL